MSFRVSLVLSYLHRDQHCDAFPRDRLLQLDCALPAPCSPIGGDMETGIPISLVLSKAWHCSWQCYVGPFLHSIARSGPKPLHGSWHLLPLPPSQGSLLHRTMHCEAPGTLPGCGCLLWVRLGDFPFLCQSLPRSSRNEQAAGEQVAQLCSSVGGRQHGHGTAGRSVSMARDCQAVTKAPWQGPLARYPPVPVVHVLPDECVWCHGAVLVHLWHVHIIDEVDELLAPGRAVVPPGFFLQGLLKDSCIGER